MARTLNGRDHAADRRAAPALLALLVVLLVIAAVTIAAVLSGVTAPDGGLAPRPVPGPLAQPRP